jgi:hypothetical protein
MLSYAEAATSFSLLLLSTEDSDSIAANGVAGGDISPRLPFPSHALIGPPT